MTTLNCSSMSDFTINGKKYEVAIDGIYTKIVNGVSETVNGFGKTLLIIDGIATTLEEDMKIINAQNGDITTIKKNGNILNTPNYVGGKTIINKACSGGISIGYIGSGTIVNVDQTDRNTKISIIKKKYRRKITESECTDIKTIDVSSLYNFTIWFNKFKNFVTDMENTCIKENCVPYKHYTVDFTRIGLSDEYLEQIASFFKAQTNGEWFFDIITHPVISTLPYVYAMKK